MKRYICLTIGLGIILCNAYNKEVPEDRIIRGKMENQGTTDDSKIDKYVLDYYLGIPINEFLKKDSTRIWKSGNIDFSRISEFYRFEGGRTFIYPQLHAADAGKLTFFNPYTSSFLPSIEYFSKNNKKIIQSDKYIEGKQLVNDSIRNKYSHLLKVNRQYNNEFIAAIDQAEKKGVLYIYDLKTRETQEVNIQCPMNIESSYGYSTYQTNVGNYTIQQRIYFDVKSKSVFLSVDGLDNVFVYDLINEEVLLCTDISATVVHALFVGITKANNVVFYDRYDYTFKVIDKHGSLLYEFEASHPKGLEGLTYTFDRYYNKLYMGGIDRETLTEKIYSKVILIPNNDQ